MTGSRALISDNHRINNDAGTYLFYAKLAARNERSGSLSTAEALKRGYRKATLSEINASAESAFGASSDLYCWRGGLWVKVGAV